MSSLKGNRAIITGAGGAIGAATAVRFAREGASVGLVDISAEDLSATARRIRESGGTAIEVSCDVRRERDVAAAIDEIVVEFGGLDILFANAGIMPHSDQSVLHADFAQWRTIIDVNLFGIAAFVKYAAPHIASAGGGAIVTMGSFLAVLGCSYPQDGYTASKGAVASLTRSLAVQLGPQKIRVNAMAPGPILTPHVEKFFANEEARKKRLARVPLGRFGTVEDAAALATFLASDDASWLTGQTIILDGGISVNYL
jgi:NAD(P)-dependent dehydrogenase (short-subunit alcohol dehydrogenase family)